MHWSSAPGAAQSGFTTQERDRRWARVRGGMAEAGVDLLLVFPQWMAGDALYLANRTGVIVFPREGEPSIIIGGEDSHRAARRAGWIEDRRSATATGTTRVPYGEAAAALLRGMGVGSKRVAIAGLRGGAYGLVRQPEGYLNYTTVAAVMAAMPEADVVDGTPILAEARYVKSEEEIDLLRSAVEIGEACARAVHERVRPGMSQAEAYGQVLLEQIRLRASEPLLAWCPGAWGEPKHRFTSPPPGDIGDTFHLCLEIFPSVRGYNAQIAEPFFVGPVPSEARDAFEVGRMAFDRGCELMRPGATWGEVEEGVLAVGKGPASTWISWSTGAASARTARS